MRRKLSTIEQVIDGNITYTLHLEGELELARLRHALAWLQQRHPALRMLIRKERDGLYYEDCAPPIPLRVVDDADAAAVAREREAEQYTPFACDQPQLRLAWLRIGPQRHVLLISANHRICDGMSVLTIARELLRATYADEPPVPYAEVTVQDVVGDFDDGKRWRRKLLALGMNALIRLLPASRKPPDNREHYLIWDLSDAATAALKRRCRSEGVSMHATFVAALVDAFTVLGKRAPDWLDSPMDARRGRLSMLREDMLFFGGGTIRLRTRPRGGAFWDQARRIHEEIRVEIDKELEGIPSRYQLCGMLNPPSAGKMRRLTWLGDRVSRNGSWNVFSLSNLGNLAFDDPQAPFRLTELTIHVHSFTIRMLGIIIYAVHGRMRFIFVSDGKCLNPGECETLRQALMERLGRYVDGMAEQPAGTSVARDAIADRAELHASPH